MFVPCFKYLFLCEMETRVGLRRGGRGVGGSGGWVGGGGGVEGSEDWGIEGWDREVGQRGGQD